MRQLRRAAGAVPRQWLRPGLAERRPTIARSYREYSRGRAATDSPGTLLPPLLCLVPFLNRSISNLVRPDFHNGRSDKVLLRHLIKMLPVVLLVAQSFHPFSPGLPRAPAVIAATRATAPVMLEEFRENMFNKLEAYEKRVAKRTFAGFVAGAVGAGVIGLLSMSGVPANADVNTIGADVVTQAVELSKTQKVVAEKAEQVAKIALEKVAAAEAAEKLAAERLAAAEMAYATKLHSNEAAYATQLSSMSGTVKDLEAEQAEVRLALEKLFAESAASLETARAPLEAALADAKQAETVARGRETAARQQAEEALKQAAAARQQAGLAVQAASSVVKTAAKVGPVDWKDTSTQIITALSVLAAGQAWMAVSGRSAASATEGKPPPRENPNYIREAFEETLGGGAPPGELTRGAWALGRLPSAQPRPAASPAWSAPVGQAPAQAWSASAQAPGQWKSLRAAPLKRDALTIFFEGLENLKLDSLGWWQGRGLPSPLTSTAPTATVTFGQQVPQDGYAPQQSSTATAAAWTTAKESADRLLARDAAAERAAAAASWSNEALSWSPQEAAQQAWRAMQQAPQGTGAPPRADPYAETTQQAWRNVQQAPAQYQALAPYQAPAPSATIAPGSADGMRFRPLRASPATRTAAPPIFEARRQPSPPPRGVVTKTRRGDRASKVLLTRAGQPKRALPRPAGQEVLGPRPPKNALWRAAERAQQVEPAQPGQGWW